MENYGKALKEEKPFDAAILDLTIPGGMGGRDAVKKLLELNPKAKVIVSSGYSNDPILVHCENYGFTASLKKPIGLIELAKVMKETLQ